MKKKVLLNKTLVFLLAVSVISIIFTGCGNSNQSAGANSTGGKNSTRNGGFDPSQRKEQIENNIASLVSSGTITQSQADKIVAALTTNTQRFNGQRSGSNNQQNGQQNNGRNNYQGNRPGGQRMNPLGKLVSDGVITQAQADAVMQKIRGNFGRPQGSTTGTASTSSSS